jgi:hypothetical protein
MSEDDDDDDAATSRTTPLMNIFPSTKGGVGGVGEMSASDDAMAA